MVIDRVKIGKAFRHPVDTCRFLVTVLRGHWYKFKYTTLLKRAKFGKGLRVNGKLIIKGPGKVFFGDDVSCAGTVTPFTHSFNAKIIVKDDVFLNGTRFGAAELITIGSKCILADCRIMDTDFHSLKRDRHAKDATVETAAVNIGTNVWVGANAAVLKGVTIGDNSVIGFGSVVVKDLEANIIAGGNPARYIKKIPK